MSHYTDLGSVCQAGHGDDVRAVGWLDPAHEYPRGPVSAEFTNSLRTHLDKPWQAFTLMGIHWCEFCPGPIEESPNRFKPAVEGGLGHRNLYIPTIDVVYIAPEMILHYVVHHEYQPPTEFQQAVVACPPQQSPEFMALLWPFRKGTGMREFDRHGAEKHAARQAKLDGWTHRGMCGECQCWFYFRDQDGAPDHCDQPLINVQPREHHPAGNCTAQRTVESPAGATSSGTWWRIVHKVWGR